MTKCVKILVVIMITVAIALTSFFVMKKAYDERVKELKKYIDKQTVTRDGSNKCIKNERVIF